MIARFSSRWYRGSKVQVRLTRVFKALSEKGNVAMPIQETSWARRFGMLVDQYGTPWMINCSKEG